MTTANYELAFMLLSEACRVADSSQCPEWCATYISGAQEKLGWTLQNYDARAWTAVNGVSADSNTAYSRRTTEVEEASFLQEVVALLSKALSISTDAAVSDHIRNAMSLVISEFRDAVNHVEKYYSDDANIVARCVLLTNYVNTVGAEVN